MLSVRDPIHGFIRADPLEAALVDTRPLQRLRSVRQLGLTSLVFPGAEHTRFSHALGAMHLAGRIYDALAAHAEGLLEPDRDSRQRRLVRVAALLHDIGHAPYSHSAEELFEGGIDHEEMSRRLLSVPELEKVFATHGEGLEPTDVARLLQGGASGPDADPSERLLSQIVASELDVDKMDYLLRDSLFCGVRYGNYDLARLVDTVRPIFDPETKIWGVGVAEGGVHALEALVMARYYMFTQVYFNPSVQALELHMGRWLEESGHRWPSDPMAFLDEDDLTTFTSMRRSSNHHAHAVVQRDAFPLSFETPQHLSESERQAFAARIPTLLSRFGPENLLVSHSSKTAHRLGPARVLVQLFDGEVQEMEQASHFIRHLHRIDRFRIYSKKEIQEEVKKALESP